jgi:two-component system, NtrC family, sensor kinase
MRIVTKINLALAAVVGVSALLNFAALQFTVTPSFRSLENDTAERNHSRAIEAIEAQKSALASSAKDWGFWDDTYQFMHGERPDYIEKNIDPDSLGALGVNYMLLVRPSGEVVVSDGYLFSGEEPTPIRLFDTDRLADGHPWLQPFESPAARSALIRTDQGIVALGYAPILTSERAGEAAGVLVFGKILDIEALKEATKVDFDLLPATVTTPASEVVRGPQNVEIRSALPGIDGPPLAVLVSTTGRDISALGDRAVWAAMVLLLASGMILVASLAFMLRRIAVSRIEAMRAHLVHAASTGKIELMAEDQLRDELSETMGSFNYMAGQLNELREKLRRQDYSHGAADQAAGILHNVRNAMSPIGTIAWDLTRAEDVPWKQNLAKALEQLADPSIDPARVEKLQQFVALSAGKLLDEGRSRKAELLTLSDVVRHVDEILRDSDALSQSERSLETVEVRATATAAAQLIASKTNAAFICDLAPDAAVLGHRVVLEQVLGNLLVNAADAIDATGKAVGAIRVTASETLLGDSPALDITITDDGDGIASEHLQKIFEKGFSTRARRSSGLGLHWCANVINAMGGRLFAESKGVGCGATLHLILPRMAAVLEKAA